MFNTRNRKTARLVTITTRALGLILFTIVSWSPVAWSAFADDKSQAATNASLSQSLSKNQSQPDYLPIPQEDLVYMHTTEGMLIMQITDIQSPNAAAQFKNLVREGFYNNLDFYRVVDGFVIQGGEQEFNPKTSKKSQYRQTLKAEFTRPVPKDSSFHVVQSPALLAPETGFINGFPAGRDLQTNEEWLLHCPGAVAMARNNEPDTASTEFYAVIGHAPRHLDRNMSVIGRIIEGMEHAQAMHRGPLQKSGVIDDPAHRTKILSASIGSDMMPIQQRNYMIENTLGERFNKRIASARHNSGPFLVYPGTGNVDICYYRPRIKAQ